MQNKPFFNIRPQPTAVTSELTMREQENLRANNGPVFNISQYATDKSRYVLILKGGSLPQNIALPPANTVPNLNFHFMQLNKSGRCFIILAYAARDIEAGERLTM